MKLDELESAVALQKKAYGLLLWLQQRARTNPKLFGNGKAEPFASGETCAEWISQQIGSIPQQFQPGIGQLKSMGFLLASFFSTSFRVADVRHWDSVETTFVPGAIAVRGRRHKRAVKRRQACAADELTHLALMSLAGEQGLVITANRWNKAAVSESLCQDLTLWTYGCELVRRCHYASQGAAVHRLWLELDEKVRKNLSTELIWKARERLMQWLTSPVVGEQQ